MKIILSFIFIFLSASAFALETDQFIAANVKLRDSSDVMNEYFQQSISKALHFANRKNLACEEVALKVMEFATGKYSISKASTFASASPLIDRYPEDAVSERGYINQSFYQHAWLPLQVVDLARTININGIYLGTDKFGHFTRMGMSYYKTYLKLIEHGETKSDAIKKAIIKGFGSEYGILGYGIGGVLSYGDLEANYQGFMFALDMCSNPNPILIIDQNQWTENPNHLFDVKNYFTPQMDESFNLSFWRKPLYKKIKEKLINEYFEAQQSALFQERISFYRQSVKANLNDELIKENISTQTKYDRRSEDPVTEINDSI